LGFRFVFPPKSSFKVPTSTTPNELDRELKYERVWVQEQAVTSCQEAPNLPARSAIYFAVIVRGFCARKDSGNMPDRCVVAGCSSTSNAEKEIALHKIPFFGGHRSEAKARRKKWADFVKLKRAKLTATASSAVCSCYFAPEDFARRHCFGSPKQQRTLIKDEIGILPIPRFQRNTFEEEELTLRTRRQMSVYACCFGLVSLS